MGRKPPTGKGSEPTKISAASGKLYDVRISPAAGRELRKLAKKGPRRLRKTIVAAIDALKSNPRPSGAEKPSALENIYRIPIAKDYRLIYQIRKRDVLVVVLKISDRKNVYRDIFTVVQQRIKAFEISSGAG
ncbi:MAG: type II toxin-antitoxin system RelE family toxin [Candidatus Binatia bacterium]